MPFSFLYPFGKDTHQLNDKKTDRLLQLTKKTLNLEENLVNP